MRPRLSVLVYLDAADTLERCADSILNGSGLPEEELQVLFLDPALGKDADGGVGRGSAGTGGEGAAESAGTGSCEGGTKSAATGSGGSGTESASKDEPAWLCSLRQKYPSAGLELLSVPGKEMAGAYNCGLSLAEGELISFMLSSAWFSCGAPGRAAAHAEKDKAALITMRPEYRGTEGVQGTYSACPPKGGLLNAEEVPGNVQLMLHPYLVGRELLEGLRFREELHEEAQNELVLQLLMKNRGRCYYEDQAVYCYSVLPEDGADLTELSEQKWWYEDSVRRFLLEFLQKAQEQYRGKIPVYLQGAVYYFLCAKFFSNLAGRDKFMLRREEVPLFYELCFDVLTMIDNDVICQDRKLPQMLLPRALHLRFLEGKAEKQGCEFVRVEEKNAVKCRFVERDSRKIISEYVIGNLADEILDIQVINDREGCLEIDGFFMGADYLEENSFELYGQIEGKDGSQIPAGTSEIYSLLKCFGVTYARKYPVHLCISIEELLGKRFSVFVKYGSSSNRLKLKFTSMNSRLLTYCQSAYWRFGHGQYILNRTGRYLQVSKSSSVTVLKKELHFLLALMLQKDRREALPCMAARLYYWLSLPFFRNKRIWITFDKLFKAGDNGEYFFQYCQRQQDGIDCYYVINRDAQDCARLKKQHPRRILYAGTWRCRLMALRAEAILATHAGTAAYLGFPVKYHKYFKDLFQPDNICIQHGLTIQQIAKFQNRLYANTKLYCCASPFELENVGTPIYGYRPEMLKLTGLARYDGLKNNDKKQILITPTWRKGLVHTKGVGLENEHSSHFKETAYYRIYNSLINDETLIHCARECGYRVIFLLHPAMSAQLEDYDRNSYVELVQATGNMNYEQILTESSLMVTDYSGVQFDFAYQRKPLVYYHPDALPPHYEEGGLIYSTMGFGPICTDHGQIVETLCRYMREGCRMEPEYIARADRFFAFRDHENAARIYQEVIRFEKEKGLAVSGKTGERHLQKRGGGCSGSDNI